MKWTTSWFLWACFKHVNKSYDNISGIVITDLLMNLMSCHVFLKNNDSVVIIKCPNRMFEYYFSTVFIHFYCNKRNLEKLPSDAKNRIYAEVTDNSDKVMICSTTITSTSNTLKNLLVNASSHSSYIQKQFNDKKDMIINIFTAYFVPLIKEINHKEFL